MTAVKDGKVEVEKDVRVVLPRGVASLLEHHELNSRIVQRPLHTRGSSALIKNRLGKGRINRS